jgi:hypothetical protein
MTPRAPWSREWFDAVEHPSYPAALASRAISHGTLKIG